MPLGADPVRSFLLLFNVFRSLAGFLPCATSHRYAGLNAWHLPTGRILWYIAPTADERRVSPVALLLADSPDVRHSRYAIGPKAPSVPAQPNLTTTLFFFRRKWAVGCRCAQRA